jgi:hypothetical protein
MESIIVHSRATHIIHLSALLSMTAEKNPKTAIEINNIGSQVRCCLALPSLALPGPVRSCSRPSAPCHLNSSRSRALFPPPTMSAPRPH